jgi:hypothetical protein
MPVIAAATMILTSLAIAAAPPPPQSRTAGSACDRFAQMDRADGALQQGRAPRAERLDRLPSGDLYLTVERRIRGCHIPVIVRQDIGRAP